MKEEEEEVGKRRRVGVDPREEGPRWGGGGGGGRCSRAMNYAVGRGLGPRQAWRRRRRGGGTLFEVVTSEIRRKREGECKRERERAGPQPLCPTFLSIFHLNFYVTTLDTRYAPDTLAEPIEIFIPTRLPFQFTYERNAAPFLFPRSFLPSILSFSLSLSLLSS